MVALSFSRWPSLSSFCAKPPALTAISTLSLHDALPISARDFDGRVSAIYPTATIQDNVVKYVAALRIANDSGGLLRPEMTRSEEHTSELQSPCNLVCRLLLEKKKKYQTNT